MDSSTVPDVHVVILTWNHIEDTVECLDSMVSQEGVRAHIIVVDNGSTDDTVATLRRRYPEVIVIENGRNLGVPAGFNVGIRYALAKDVENILLLNNDTVAHPQMLYHLVNQLDRKTGIVSPLIYYASEPQKVWSIGGMINPLLLEMVKPQGGNVSPPEHTTLRTFLPSCATLVKRYVFEEAGMFDERFSPIYYDDLDFCLRAMRKGIGLAVVPEAVLWHKVSQSSGGEYKPRERYYMARNSGIYFRKNMFFWQAPLILPYRLGSAILWTWRLSRKRNFSGLRAYWLGLYHGWIRPPAAPPY